MQNRYRAIAYLLLTFSVLPVSGTEPETQQVEIFLRPHGLVGASKYSQEIEKRVSPEIRQEMKDLLEKTSVPDIMFDQWDNLAAELALQILRIHPDPDFQELAKKVMYATANPRVKGEAASIVAEDNPDAAIGELERAAHAMLDRDDLDSTQVPIELGRYVKVLIKIGTQDAKESHYRIAGRYMDRFVTAEQRKEDWKKLEELWNSILPPETPAPSLATTPAPRSEKADSLSASRRSEFPANFPGILLATVGVVASALAAFLFLRRKPPL
jgi:hypothetical protein